MRAFFDQNLTDSEKTGRELYLYWPIYDNFTEDYKAHAQIEELFIDYRGKIYVYTLYTN